MRSECVYIDRSQSADLNRQTDHPTRRTITNSSLFHFTPSFCSSLIPYRQLLFLITHSLLFQIDMLLAEPSPSSPARPSPYQGQSLPTRRFIPSSSYFRHLPALCFSGESSADSSPNAGYMMCSMEHEIIQAHSLTLPVHDIHKSVNTSLNPPSLSFPEFRSSVGFSKTRIDWLAGADSTVDGWSGDSSKGSSNGSTPFTHFWAREPLSCRKRAENGWHLEARRRRRRSRWLLERNKWMGEDGEDEILKNDQQISEWIKERQRDWLTDWHANWRVAPSARYVVSVCVHYHCSFVIGVTWHAVMANDHLSRCELIIRTRA